MLNLSLTRRFWQIFSTTWLWKNFMWSLNYQHILASVIRYVHTKWVAPNKCYATFFVHWFDQVPYSITARKESAVVFFQFEDAEFSDFFTFFDFDRKYHFWVNLAQTIVSLLWNLVPGLIQNLMAMLNFAAFYWNYPFWAN